MMTIVCLVLLVPFYFAQYTTIANFTGRMFQNFHQISLVKNDKIEVNVVWKLTLAPKTSSNLDLYLIKNGTDLKYLPITYSVTDNVLFQVQPLIYTITESNTYYVMVK